MDTNSNSKFPSSFSDTHAGDGNISKEAQGKYKRENAQGKICAGTLVGGDNTGQSATVKLESGVVISGVLWAAGIVAGFLGIRTRALPVVGTRVAVMLGETSYVVGVVGGGPKDTKGGWDETMTQALDPYTSPRGELDYTGANDKSPYGKGVTIPTDMLDGELDMTNQLSVGVRLLTNLAQLSGGPLAKVEACVVNDMVRILSDTFRQFSAFGDMEIYNDGRLNVRFDGTSYEFEAWGLEGPTEPKVELKEGDDTKVEAEEDIMNTGRWRFSQDIGWLGEFVHQFVTEPDKVIEEMVARPGKSRLQQMSDGSVLIQSVADIAIERVCRVQVPVEKKRWEDPQGVKASDFGALDTSFLKVWAGDENWHHAAYQLREYARWLSCFHSYARFHQMADKGGEWNIPVEDAEESTPSWTNQEDDVESANPDLEYIDAYACYRIIRDGTVVIQDGYGGSYVGGKSGVDITSVTHINLDAAGDIRCIAGGDFIVKARRNVEISAIAGGLILKARAWWKALCEKGVLWIKGDAKDPAVEEETQPEGEEPPDYPDYQQEEYAVIIEARNGKAALRSKRTLNLAAEGNPTAGEAEDQANIDYSVIIGSRRQDVRVFGSRNALVRSAGNYEGTLGLESRNTIVDTSNFFCTARLFDVRPALDRPGFTLRGSKVNVGFVYADWVSTTTRLAGPELGAQAIEDMPPGFPPLRPHKGHVSLVDPDEEYPEYAEEDDLDPLANYLDDEDRNPLAFTAMYGSPTSAPAWKYPETDDYRWPFEAPEDRPLFQPLSQQRLSSDEEFDEVIDDWNFVKDNLKYAPGTSPSSYPYPGQGAQEQSYPDGAGEQLHLPLETPHSAQNNYTPLVSRTMKRKYYKRNEEE